MVCRLTQKDIDDFFNGFDKRKRASTNRKADAIENAVSMPYNDVFEINEVDLVYGMVVSFPRYAKVKNDKKTYLT